MKNRLLTFAALLILAPIAFASAQNSPRDNKPIAAIRAVLDAQVAAWNRGDLEGYMDGYQRSPDIVFISGDRVTRGWKTVLDRYKTKLRHAREDGRADSSQTLRSRC